MRVDVAAIGPLFYEAFNERDFERGASFLLESAAIVDVAAGETYVGQAGLKRLWGEWVAAFPDVTVEIVNSVVSGQGAALEFIVRGTQDGPLGDLAPTGRPVELRFCDVIEFRSGKIAGIHFYFDSATLASQLGRQL